jgi:hypothetical protein
MSEKNGNVKWWQLVSAIIGILSIVAVLTTWGANQVIAIDLRSTQRDTELKDCIHNYILPMKEAIARIEVKLEKE